ncbi:hypothetical protein EDC04DRAFT_2902751 [Pisolithus marmoratus]|nr:hypothetical protein EDC04DRAFT_2902751 [Pisolithus marmoratus]
MSSPPPESETLCSFTVTLTVYSNLKKKTQKGKVSVAKEGKSMKTKELLFPLRDNNYLSFLQSLLEKHGQDQFKVSERNQCIGNMLDVNNEVDYQEMVGKILSINPSVTKIFINMKHVEKLPSDESSNKEEGQATLHLPPNIKSFNMANKVTHLHPTCKAQALAQPPPVDLNVLTSILLLQTLMKSGILSSPAPPMPPLASIPSPVPPI